MKIAVFIKQVPDTNDVKWTENNNIDRANMESIMNPADKSAIEIALNIKNTQEAEITAITMGPGKAVSILQEAIAMGVDDAFLLCDSKFAGSDTCATSKVLASAIKEKYPEPDLILFGQSAIDGETSQTGHSTAKRLNVPCIDNVVEIVEINEDSITTTSETENEIKTLKTKFPCCICVKDLKKARLPKINGYIKAQKHNYKTYNLYDLNLSETQTGVKGSPTYVCKIYRNSEGRNGKIVENTDELYEEIKKAKQ